MVQQSKLAAWTCVSMVLAVSLGALGAHFLKQKMTEGMMTIDQLNSFETGVKYQIYHSLALLIFSFIPKQQLPKASLPLMGLGMVLFSFSIYALSTRTLIGFENLKYLGAITPIGGVLMIVSWLILGFHFLKSNKK
jgi:uncharacterized membrane protein YgdD (TMEM256/DUF423 family)